MRKPTKKTGPERFSQGIFLKNNNAKFGLYDSSFETSSCGVGFLTRKDGKQTHELLLMGHEALCAVPHRGGMSAEGVGDGAGVCVDLSYRFFCKLTGKQLQVGAFGVGNFFLPDDLDQHARAEALIAEALEQQGMRVIRLRDVDINNSAIRPAIVRHRRAKLPNEYKCLP